MTPQVFKARVQGFSAALMCATILFLVYYMYSSFQRAYRFCFGEPELWADHWRVEDAAIIENSSRVSYFLIWSVVILLSAIATVAAIHLLNRCRKGLIFDAGTARSIQVLGGILVVAMIGDQVFGALELYLVTQHNPVHVELIRWQYDPTDFKTAALAVVLFMFGWVMRDAIEVEQTNKGFA